MSSNDFLSEWDCNSFIVPQNNKLPLLIIPILSHNLSAVSKTWVENKTDLCVADGHR